MVILKNLKDIKYCDKSVLTIGSLDGMHKGHQKVFIQARKLAKRNKLIFGVLTFSPLPVMFFNKQIKNYRLASEYQKFKLFKKYRVDFVINIKFNKNFSKISVDQIPGLKLTSALRCTKPI